jgi:hypothetical protein
MPVQTALRNTSSVQVWKFPVQNNRSRFVDGGTSFFKAQSKGRANALGCRVVTTEDVKLERSLENAWNITGTVVLENRAQSTNQGLCTLIAGA